MRPSLNVDHELVHAMHAGRMHECSEYRVNVHEKFEIHAGMDIQSALLISSMFVP